MKKLILASIYSCLLILSFSVIPAQCEEIEIVVSPNVINIASASTVVTVHTNIAFSVVAGATVTLNGIEINWWKSDNQGNFVAKFIADEVKGIVVPGNTATLTLTGVTKEGEGFTGSDDVDVIDLSATGKK